MDTSHLMQLESCTPTPSTLIPIPSTASHIVTPLLPHHREGLLCQHPDQSLATYAVSSLSSGFHIRYQYDMTGGLDFWHQQTCLCLYTTTLPVEQYLSTELAAGRIAGLFLMFKVPLVQVSRFGVVPRNSRPGEWHLILDLSFPPQESINDGIEPCVQCGIPLWTKT